MCKLTAQASHAGQRHLGEEPHCAPLAWVTGGWLLVFLCAPLPLDRTWSPPVEEGGEGLTLDFTHQHLRRLEPGHCSSMACVPKHSCPPSTVKWG